MYMSERTPRRRTPATTSGADGGGLSIKNLPHPSRSSSQRRSGHHHHHHRHHRHQPPSEQIRVLKRCASESVLVRTRKRSCGSGVDELGCHQKQGLMSMMMWPETEEDGGVLYGSRPLARTDATVSSPSLMVTSPSFLASAPQSFEGNNYKRDSKVVVNVTVEGSPGPVRTMVELGLSVEDTIKLVIDKYSEEGRTPKFDKDATSSYELHHSYFSLESLDKEASIGDIGSRSFYLRRSGSSYSERKDSSGSLHSNIVPMNATAASSPSPPLPPPFLLTTFIARKLGKLARRTSRIWKILFCW